VHGDRDVGLLARVLAAGQLGAERPGVAGAHPGQRLVQAVQHAAAADLVGQAAGLGVLDRVAVHAGRQVDRHVVARLDRPVGALQRGEPLAQRAQVLIHLLVGDVRVVHGDRHTVDVGQVELRPHVDLGGERQLLAVVQLGDLHLGLAEREHLVLLQGLAVQLGHRVVDRVLEHRAAADPLVDDPRRDPAGPEPGHPYLPAHLPVGVVEVRLELLERDLDGQADPGRAQLLDVSFHAGTTPRIIAGKTTASRRGQWGGHARLRPPSLGQMHTAPIRLGLGPTVPPRTQAKPAHRAS
jgi:hypothetical protein